MCSEAASETAMGGSMKNLSFLVILLCLVATLCSCSSPGESLDRIGGRVSTPGPPRFDLPLQGTDINETELGRRIRQDYSNKYGSVSGVRIKEYYGTYNDCVVVIISHNEPPAPIYLDVDVIIGETLFRYNLFSFWMVVWKEGKFYELKEAYDQGLLTNDDLKSVADYYYGDRAEEMNLEYNAGLLWDINFAIRSSFCTDFEPYFPQEFSIESVKYYGSYKYFDLRKNIMDRIIVSSANDHVAVMITVEDYDYTDAAWEETVADTLFRYSNGNRILLWKMEKPDGQADDIKGHFYKLQDAYDLGLLTKNDIRNIAYYHETGKTISYELPYYTGWRK